MYKNIEDKQIHITSKNYHTRQNSIPIYNQEKKQVLKAEIHRESTFELTK